MLLLVSSCKKNSTNNPAQSNTFFHVYNVPIAKNNKTTNTTIASSGSMACDANGNIYAWYSDSVISGFNRFAILKTDKNGNKIWNTSYFPFSPCQVDIDLDLNNYFWQDFICMGQSLFIAGRDTANNWQVIKINCSDGSIAGRFPLNSLEPSYSYTYFLIYSIWPTKDGNILINAFSNIGGFGTPVLAKMDPSGNIIWVNNSFPSRVPDSADFEEFPYCVMELNGNYVYGTVGMYQFTGTGIDSAYALTSSTLYLHYLSSASGNILNTDSLTQGTYNSSSASPAFINGNGASQVFSIFPSSLGGYIILSSETYDYITDLRVKILKTDTALHVTDSSYISLGNSIVSCAVQDNAGDIIMSVFSEVLPIPNAICMLYKIAPDGSVTAHNQVGLSNQSAFISGMYPTSDDYILMSGLIQFSDVDTNNLFILKTDNNVHF
jgi:hypothetical protein